MHQGSKLQIVCIVGAEQIAMHDDSWFAANRDNRDVIEQFSAKSFEVIGTQ